MIEVDLGFLRPQPDLNILNIMLELSRQPDTSQHGLAEHLGLSPTAINKFIKLLDKNGLVEIIGNSKRSMSYHLTEAGHRHRDALLIAFSADVARIYATLKRLTRGRINDLLAEGLRKVVLFGAAETCELVMSAAEGTALEVIGLVDSDPRKQGAMLRDLVIGMPENITWMKPDGVIITSSGHQEEIFRSISLLEDEGIKVRKLSPLVVFDEGGHD